MLTIGNSLLNIIKSKQRSLAQQYLFFTIIVVSLIISSILWVSYSTYKSYDQEHNISLIQEAQKIQITFDEKITFGEHFLRYIGTKIQHSTTKNIETIANIISQPPDNSKKNGYIWNTIAFTNSNYQITATNSRGVIDPLNIKDVYPQYLDWLKHKVRLDSQKIHFSTPNLSVITNDYVFPMGISIYDKIQHHLIGFLIMGIKVEKLTSSLLNIMNKDISFIILDGKNNVISTSEPFIENDIKVDKKLTQDANSIYPKKLTSKLEFGNFIFTYYLNSSKFPFTILIGYDSNNYSQQFKKELLPKVSIYIFLGIVFTSILLFLAYQVIKPILELGEAADDISKGKPIQIPRYKAKELNVLAHQLENISNTTKSLRKKQTQLSHANTELKNANEFIRSNMSFLSHELTNPVSSIIGFAKILHQKVKQINNDELTTFSDIIYKTAVHQSKQLIFFLKSFQFQEAKKRMEVKKINVKEMIEWNISMIRHHAAQQNIKIHIGVEPNLTLYGDEIMIGQLIQNLASNGAKYNKPGGTLRIKAYQQNYKNLTIEVADTGIGIAKKDLDKIFKIFTRIKNKNNKSIGYGIGLAYAKRCIEAHNGTITVKSKLGAGTTFKVTLPIGNDKTQQAQTSAK